MRFSFYLFVKLLFLKSKLMF